VKLSLGPWSQTQPLTVSKDPRIAVTPAEFDEQLELMLDMRADLDRLYDGVRQVRALRTQAHDLVARLAAAGQDTTALARLAGALTVALDAVENELMQPKNEADQDVENFPTKIDNQLAYVYGLVGETDARPSAGQRERAADLKRELDAALAKLDRVIAADVAAFDVAAAKLGGGPLIVPRRR
jgi:hypothetical protein